MYRSPLAYSFAAQNMCPRHSLSHHMLLHRRQHFRPHRCRTPFHQHSEVEEPFFSASSVMFKLTNRFSNLDTHFSHRVLQFDLSVPTSNVGKFGKLPSTITSHSFVILPLKCNARVWYVCCIPCRQMLYPKLIILGVKYKDTYIHT